MPQPINGIAATMFHGEGAIAQCGRCRRYTLDRAALSDRQPICICGERHYWSGSFMPPGPDAQWCGPAPEAQAAPAAVSEPSTTAESPEKIAREAFGYIRDGATKWDRENLRDCIDKLFALASAHPAAAPAAAQPVAQETVALTWYEGAPPFPQDQEWFIAETIHGDRVVLRSLDEGREHKRTYRFKTADDTYMAARFIKRWMQFPDCDYIPPAATPPALVGLSDEQIMHLWFAAEPTPDGRPASWNYARAVERAMAAANGMTLKEPAGKDGAAKP